MLVGVCAELLGRCKGMGLKVGNLFGGRRVEGGALGASTDEKLGAKVREARIFKSCSTVMRAVSVALGRFGRIVFLKRGSAMYARFAVDLQGRLMEMSCI